MEHGSLHLVARTSLGPLLVQIVNHYFLDTLGRLIGYDSNGEFAHNFPGDDGFSSRVGKGALNAVQRQRGKSPTSHQCLNLVALVDQFGRLQVVFVVIDVKINGFVLGTFTY